MSDNIDFEYVQNGDNFNFKKVSADEDSNPLYSNNIHNCQYYEEEACLEKMQNIKNETFSVLSLNIRSLPGKFTEFKNFLAASFGSFKPNIICLQEIWNVGPYDNFDIDGYHPFNFKIRNIDGLNSNAGGGVGVYIDRQLTPLPLAELSHFIPRVFESQFFKIKTGKNKFMIIGNIYRPNTAPYADLKRCNTLLNEILAKLKSNPEYKNAKDIMLVGDVNIDLLKTGSHSDSGVYLDTLLENGLLPLVTLPTRIGNRCASIIDHISTNITDDSYDVGIIVSDISDHFPVFYVRHFENKKEKVLPIKVRKIDERSKLEFRSALENHDWNNVINNFNPESSFDNFFEVVNFYYERSFPEKFINPSNKNKIKSPWMTEGLMKSRKHKQKLYSKKMYKPCPENNQKFKEYNSMYTNIIRKAKQQYYDDKFLAFSKDCKKTWQTINEVLGKRKKFNDIPKTFVCNGKILSGALDIAEGFNEFFANIGPKLAKAIPKSDKHFSEYLTDPCPENFIFANTTHSIINEALSKLKGKHSSGPDNISTSMLKFVAPSIMDPLSHLLNLSFKSGYIPTCLKTAVIKPIYKKDGIDNFTNYRPISLLSSFSKLLEKVAANQIMKYLNKFKLLYEHQYGFRAKFNTTQPMLHLIDKIFNALNNPNENKFTLAIFIDLTKAFDTCDTEILLHKLNHYGFRGISNVWFENYLSGRKQYTSIRGVNSSLKELSCGVPQGSILGPILFILLINDLPYASDFFSLLYADDTTLTMSDADLIKLFKLANLELAKLADWFKANRLTLNISKTKFILFRNKTQGVDFSNLHLNIDNEEIERIGFGCKEESFKFVGIHLDEYLTFDHHVKYVRGKVAGAVFALSKLRNLLPKHIKYTVYNSLFRSHIEFGVTAWGRSKSTNIKRICVLQKRAVRYIENAKYNSHTGQIFSKFNILKFPDLVNLNQACFMYKYVNDKLPLSFTNFFIKLQNFDRSLSFQLGRLKMSNLNCFAPYAIPKLWNELPLNLKRKISLNSFKKCYTSLLIESYSTPCTVTNCYSCRK
jgi:hypothetical protein